AVRLTAQGKESSGGSAAGEAGSERISKRHAVGPGLRKYRGVERERVLRGAEPISLVGEIAAENRNLHSLVKRQRDGAVEREIGLLAQTVVETEVDAAAVIGRQCELELVPVANRRVKPRRAARCQFRRAYHRPAADVTAYIRVEKTAERGGVGGIVHVDRRVRKFDIFRSRIGDRR